MDINAGFWVSSNGDWVLSVSGMVSCALCPSIAQRKSHVHLVEEESESEEQWESHDFLFALMMVLAQMASRRRYSSLAVVSGALHHLFQGWQRVCTA